MTEWPSSVDIFVLRHASKWWLCVSYAKCEEQSCPNTHIGTSNCEKEKSGTCRLWCDEILLKINKRKSHKKLLNDAFGRRFDAWQLIEKPYSSRCSTELRNEIIFSTDHHPIIHQSCWPGRKKLTFNSIYYSALDDSKMWCDPNWESAHLEFRLQLNQCLKTKRNRQTVNDPCANWTVFESDENNFDTKIDGRVNCAHIQSDEYRLSSRQLVSH